MEKINFINNQAPALNATNLNQLQTNIENAINGVVESGSNDNGSWVKYSDGTMICYKKLVNVTIEITTPWVSLYEGNYNAGSLPQTFAETPYIFVTPFGSGMMIEQGGLDATPSTWGSITVVRPHSVTVNNASFYLMAIGKWK